MVFFHLQMMVFEVIEAWGKGRDVHCDASQWDQDRLEVSVGKGEVCDYSAGVCAWAKTFNKEVGPPKEFEKYSHCGCKQGVGSNKVIWEPKAV